METVTLTINGNALSARTGQTILQVARRHGIDIPTLCHHDALRPIGACRLCQVEDEKRGVVVPACVTEIAPGMVISTHSERVVRNRRNIIRLLLAAHPESCVVCERGNTCELRNLAAQHGVGHHGLDRMWFHPPGRDVNPFMVRDLSKCVMCAKCVRADQEVVCEGVIDYNFRGFDAHPATLFQMPLEEAKCTFCGSCLAVCPVGAIAEKDKPRLDHAGRKTRSVCSYCACGCSIRLEHDGSTVRTVAPTGLAHTANGISLCVKGHFGHDWLSSPDRLQTPLVRTDNGLEPASWDHALDLVASRFGLIKEAGGPDALAFVAGARVTNEEAYIFQKLARTVFGTNNVDQTSRALSAPVWDELLASSGFAAGSICFKDVEQSDLVFLIGGNPTETAPVLGYHIKRAVRLSGRRLVVVDPVRTKLAGMAGEWLPVRPGCDYHLLAALIVAILEAGLEHRQYEAAKTRQSDQLREWAAGQDITELAAGSGLTVEDIRRTAGLLAAAPSAVFIFGRGLASQPGASDLVRLLTDLALITGNLGKDRAGLIFMHQEAGAQGGLDMGLAPHLLPGHLRVGDAEGLKKLSDLYGHPLSAKPGLDAFEMLKAAADGQVKGMYVLGTDLAADLPGRDGTLAALGKLEFLVVQDLFLTETAELADVVLPAASWAEKSGTVTNMERRVQRLHRAVLPPGGMPTELEVLFELALRRGRDWGPPDPDAVLAEACRSAPIYSDVDTVDLDGRAVTWPLPGTEAVHDTLPHGIGFEDGRAVFSVPQGTNGHGPALTREYPFLLIAGSLLQHLGAGVVSSRSPRLSRFYDGPFLGMAENDLSGLGLEEGNEVEVMSEDGSVILPVMLWPGLPPGSVFMPGCFGEARPGDLVGPGSGAIIHCPVRLEKVS